MKRRLDSMVGPLLIGLGLAALAGCHRAAADATPPPGKPVAVTVTISSATLADDCGPAASGPAAASVRKTSSVADVGGYAGRRACQQTSLQLALVSSAAGAPSALSIVKAQLLDVATGKPLQDLTTRSPRAWDAAGSYRPWDGVVKPGQKLAVSYDMNAPDWSKLGGGRMAAQGKSFRLVLTVRVGGEERKIETQVRSPELMLAPNVAT